MKVSSPKLDTVQSRSENENIVLASSRGGTHIVVQQAVAELDLKFGSELYIVI